MTARDLRQSVTYRSRTWLGSKRPGFALLRLSPRLRPRLVGRATDVCIEGFPRSANSLAVHAFRLDNPGATIAHHVHVPMQAARAVELRVPCAVLVRDPVDAIASLVIMSEGAVSPRTAISTYGAFYERVAEDAGAIALVEFGEVVRDPFVVARRLNDRFGATFGTPSDPEAGRRRALESVERANRAPGRRRTAMTVPTAEKEERKPRVRDTLQREPGIDSLQALYESLLDAR